MENQILYIRVNDKGTIDHPILEANLRDFYPDFEVNDPPSGFARFERVEPPMFDDFQLVEKVTYELSEELTNKYGTPTYTDVFHIREMTEEEKQAKLEFIRTNNIPEGVAVVNIPNLEAETQNLNVPPKPDGDYMWNPYTNKWVNKTQLEQIFGPFFMEHNLQLDTFNYEKLTDEQKREFAILVERSKEIV